MRRMRPATAPGSIATARLLMEARADPLAMLSRLANTYGDVFHAVYLPVLGKSIFVARAPEHVEHVLVTRQSNYVKAFTYRPYTELFGYGLINSEGELWSRQRRLAQPNFSRRKVLALAPIMTEATGRWLEDWRRYPTDRPVDVASEMNAMTLEVMGRTLFGSDLSGDAAKIGPALTTLLSAIMRREYSPLTWLAPGVQRRLPTPAERRHRAARSSLDNVVRGLIAQRRDGSGEPVNDLLDALLAGGSDGDGTEADDRRICDELMTFVIAGHETTANALSWAFYMLSTHPAVRERLEDEVERVLSGRVPGPEDVDSLPWTQAVLQETLRLYPPAWSLERDAVDEDVLGGVPVPAGSMVIVPPYLVHRHPAHWPNPEGFDPARFLSGSETRHRHAYMPFGAGRRQCIGSGFALMEGVLVLAMVTQRFRLDVAPGHRPVPEPIVTLRPASGISMTIQSR